jgi:hypothetical protein
VVLDRFDFQVKFQSVLPDSSDDKQSSADEEISNELVTTPPKLEEQTDDNAIPKRKKRKKKIVMPPEIKENVHLRKYWHRRFNLFSRFDEGIKLDEGNRYIFADMSKREFSMLSTFFFCRELVLRHAGADRQAHSAAVQVRRHRGWFLRRRGQLDSVRFHVQTRCVRCFYARLD